MSMQTLIALLFEIVEVCRKVPLMGIFRFLVFSPVMCVVVVLFWKKRRKNDEKSRCRHSEIVLRVCLCGIEQCLPALTTNFGAIHCKSDGKSVFGGHCLNRV